LTLTGLVPSLVSMDPYFPTDPETFADPYPGYHRLLDDDPQRSDLLGTWIVSRYVDVVAALRDSRLTTTGLMEARMDRIPPGHEDMIAEIVDRTSHNFASQQPPEHGQKRSVVAPRFTRERAAQDAVKVQEIVDDLLAGVPPTRAMDIIKDFAGPLPLRIISEIVGIGDGQEGLIEALGDENIELVGAPQPEVAGLVAHLRSLRRFGEVADAALVRHFESPHDDLLAQLLTAEDAGRLSRSEVVANAHMVIVAGHETTTKLIGNAFLALLRFPKEFSRLRDQPELMETAVDELLRYDPVVQTTSRLAREDLEIGGRAICAGDIVHIALGAAHRDAAQFPNPDELDLGRTPNRHLGFGIGTHNCIGANLARTEVRIALTALLGRMTPDQVTLGEVVWDPNLVFRGPTSLPIRLDN
jgi:pimeloyl-[acyl-carrier protein] synthase